MKEHNWLSYERRGEIIEIIVRDTTGARLDKFKCNNDNSFKNALKQIKKKYGFNYKPEVDREDNPFF